MTNPWQFFADHPLPWEVSRTSAGVAVEDANHEVLWRFDHFDSATPEAFTDALNAVVSVEEVPYIRGFNRGWADALAEDDDTKPWTRWLVWLSVRDWLPMWVRRRCFRLNLWLLNRGWA